MTKGIDVSSYQGKPDWGKVRTSGIDFAILRCHQKYGVDASFEHNYAGAAGNGISVGVYKYSYALNADDAVKEAMAVLDVLKGRELQLPVYYDLEDNSQVTFGKEVIEGIVNAFANTVTANGYRVGIYCNKWWYDNKLSESLKNSYPLWIAVVPSEDTGEIKESLRPADADIWQYSWKGKVDGIAGDVDMDVINGAVVWEDQELTIPESATRWMEALAGDDSHGYDQIYRWGEKGDYDCSSAVISAYKRAGLPLTCTYTGNMKADMVKNGFADVTAEVNLSTGAGLIRGDVLLNETHHTAMYVGDGKEVEASINEKGTATGGTPGDQTGKEILIRSYRNYPWNCVLRFVATREPVKTKKATIAIPYITTGSYGPYVSLIQFALNLVENAKLDVDGEFGPATDKAVKAYQTKKGVEVSGICGIGTLRRLLADMAGRTY